MDGVDKARMIGLYGLLIINGNPGRGEGPGLSPDANHSLAI